MTTSTLSICNRALDVLGASNITTLAENSAAARAMSNAYEPCLYDLLTMHFWKFATTRTTLALSVTTPAFEFDNQFALPGDYLCVQRIDPANLIYAIEDGFVLCNATELSMKYTKLVTDPTKFSSSFCELLSLLLAWRTNFKITQNGGRDEELEKRFMRQFAYTKGMDSKQGTPQKFRDDLWIASRNIETSTEVNVTIDGNIDYGNWDT